MLLPKKASLTVRCFEAHFIDEAIESRLLDLAGKEHDPYYADDWDRLTKFQQHVQDVKKRICKRE